MNKDEEKLLANPKILHFQDLKRLCQKYFGEPRNTGGSHFIFKTHWKGDPRINLQKDGKMAKAYQVKDVMQAIKKLEDKKNEKDN